MFSRIICFKKYLPLSFLIILLLTTWLLSPAEARPDVKNSDTGSALLAIVNVRIVPVVGQDIPSGTILVENGKIKALGANLEIPAGARIIEARGLTAYPGMIDGYSSLGLVEISGVSATVDNRETGRINPQVKAIEALKYDSMHIPIARANGIVAAVVAPSGGLIAGQSTLVKLDGWTNREMVIKESLALVVELPGIRGGRRGFMGMGTQQAAVSTDRALAGSRNCFTGPECTR